MKPLVLGAGAWGLLCPGCSLGLRGSGLLMVELLQWGPASLVTCPHPLVCPRLAEPKEPSPLHGLGHLIMDQSYVCALIAMMVRALPSRGLS